MQYKTAELEGVLLDAAVALARGWTVCGAWCTDPSRPNDPIQIGEPGELANCEHFAPSMLWRDGGPIIERERIRLEPHQPTDPKGWDKESPDEDWYAEIDVGDAIAFGQTPLIAAMRAYVVSKFGEVVEIDTQTTKKP